MNASRKNKNNLPSGIKCCIKKCQKSKRHFKGLKMFKFPSSNIILGKIWREKCRIAEKDFNKNLFICENHFSSSYVGKKKLKAGAIPTVHMDEMAEESEDFNAELNLDSENVEAPICTNCDKQILLVDQYRKKYSNILKKYKKIQEILKSKNRKNTEKSLSKERKKLIAEIRKRPVLWDLQTKENSGVLQQTWKQLGRAMGADANDCKRKWKMLRGIYRQEVMKLELRIVEDKSNGSYNPNNEYKSKWSFFEQMQFIDDIKNQRLLKNGNSHANDNNSDDKDSPPSSSNPLKKQKAADDKPTTSNSKCTKRSYDQANFFKSPGSDITDSNNMVHVTDADYNFLVSFLPQMKSINEMKNIQFRAKITHLMLDIVSESLANDTVYDLTSRKVNSKNYP